MPMPFFLKWDDVGRNGVVIRGVTRGIDQKMFTSLLKTQRRFKLDLESDTALAPIGMEMPGAVAEDQVTSIDETEILSQIRENVMAGGYHLIDYRGYAGYEPGDNVVNIFAMGSPTTEAIKASHALLKKGIYANVIVVTSPDLLLGNLAHADDYNHLKNGLGINADLYLKKIDATQSGEVRTLAGRRIPIVSVHDGEIGLLDNIGSLVGVRQETLAVRKHSRCGRPTEVYRYHHIDADSVFEACGKVLAETALENTWMPGETSRAASAQSPDWRPLWPVV